METPGAGSVTAWRGERRCLSLAWFFMCKMRQKSDTEKKSHNTVLYWGAYKDFFHNRK